MKTMTGLYTRFFMEIFKQYELEYEIKQDEIIFGTSIVGSKIKVPSM